MPAPELLTIAETAKYLGVHDHTIRRMISRGELRAYRYGSKLIRIDLADLTKTRAPVTPTAAYREAVA